MNRSYKGALSFILVSTLLAVSIYMLSAQYDVLINFLYSFIQSASPFGMIISAVITVGSIVGFVMLVKFLVSSPEELSQSNKLTDMQITQSDSVPNPTGRVVIDIPVSSGFKFAIGFMLGMIVMGFVFVPIISMFFVGMIGSMLPL